MDFDEYKELSGVTDLSHQLPDECHPLLYHALKLNGEAGEIAEKVGKLFRDKKGYMDDQFIVDMIDELGDVQWYLAAIARLLAISMNSVARRNIAKLQDRMERGVLHGNGDNR
jgi:NTP pyrophosphatase (non-canonical NTP hydrolase)